MHLQRHNFPNDGSKYLGKTLKWEFLVVITTDIDTTSATLKTYLMTISRKDVKTGLRITPDNDFIS
jgi:hypothetical protein